MRNKRVLLVLFIVGFSASAALAGTYLWIDLGADHHWDTTANWLAFGGPPYYPGTTDADAILPARKSPGDPAWHVSLINEDIEDLTIGRDVFFDAADGNDPTLTAATVTIGGGVTAEISDDATITTVQP